MHIRRPSSVAILSLALLLGGVLTPAGDAAAQNRTDSHIPPDAPADTLTSTILIHPVIDINDRALTLSVREHTVKPYLRLGDQLASDFSVQRVGDDGIPRTYERGTNGEKNEEWFGWRKDVVAPFDGTVTRVEAPSATNSPGTMNRKAQPGLIFFENEEGATVIYAHVREIDVEKGQRVEAGEIVAKVGNNGNSRAPHVHVGAWKDGTPLQIQMDLYEGR